MTQQKKDLELEEYYNTWIVHDIDHCVQCELGICVLQKGMFNLRLIQDLLEWKERKTKNKTIQEAIEVVTSTHEIRNVSALILIKKLRALTQKIN